MRIRSIFDGFDIRRVLRTYPWTITAAVVFHLLVWGAFPAIVRENASIILALGWAVPLFLLAESVSMRIISPFARLVPLASPIVVGGWMWVTRHDWAFGRLSGYIMALLATHLALLLCSGAGLEKFRAWNLKLARAIAESLVFSLLLGVPLAVLLVIAQAILHISGLVEWVEIPGVLLFTVKLLSTLSDPFSERRIFSSTRTRSWAVLAILVANIATAGGILLEIVEGFLYGSPLADDSLILWAFALVVTGIVAQIVVAVSTEIDPWIRRLVGLFPFTIAPLAFLLAIATGLDLSRNGYSVDQYFILVFSIWTIAAALWSKFAEDRAKVIPASLVLLCLGLAWGPTSPRAIDARIQLAEFEKMLEKEGITPKHPATSPLSKDRIIEIRKHLWILCVHYSGQGLDVWLREPWRSDLRTGDDLTRRNVADSIALRMGVDIRQMR